MGKYGEPWRRTNSGLYAMNSTGHNAVYIAVQPGCVCQQCQRETKPLDEDAVAERIRVSVNALADIPNPEAVPGLVEAVRAAPIASKYHGQNGLDPKFWNDYAEWSLRVADALRRCGVVL